MKTDTALTIAALILFAIALALQAGHHHRRRRHIRAIYAEQRRRESELNETLPTRSQP